MSEKRNVFFGCRGLCRNAVNDLFWKHSRASQQYPAVTVRHVLFTFIWCIWRGDSAPCQLSALSVNMFTCWMFVLLCKFCQKKNTFPNIKQVINLKTSNIWYLYWLVRRDQRIFINVIYLFYLTATQMCGRETYEPVDFISLLFISTFSRNSCKKLDQTIVFVSQCAGQIWAFQNKSALCLSVIFL